MRLKAAVLALGRKRAKTLAAALALFAMFAPKALESAAANGDTRTLYLYHSHSKEAIAATFRVNGHYDQETLDKLNWFLRDWRNDEPTHMDPRLFDVLWEAYRSTDRMGPDDPIVVVSAYRCPATNAMLRRRSRAVAEHSQHMLGKAMDTTMPGLSMEKLREVGMRMQRGGVGYYPRANTPFVHLDVGGVRHWPRMNYDQLVRLFPDGKTVHIPSNGKPLAGYEEARAEILARGGEAVSVAEATSGGGIGGFFASLFGGGSGGEDEEEARSAPVVRPTRVATRNARPAQPAANDEEGADAAGLDPQRQVMASAQANLPRGETFLGAPPASAAAPAPKPVAALPQSTAPTPAAELKPQPLDEAEADKAQPLDAAPTPPRRPQELTAEQVDAPLPPPRPTGLAALPQMITQGGLGPKLALRHGDDASPALAYANPPPAAVEEPTPLPPPRPTAALRAAAAAKAAADRAAPQLAPARVDRVAMTATQIPAAARRASAAVPALRAAARTDLIATPPERPAHFGAKATTLSATSFSHPGN